MSPPEAEDVGLTVSGHPSIVSRATPDQVVGDKRLLVATEGQLAVGIAQRVFQQVEPIARNDADPDQGIAGTDSRSEALAVGEARQEMLPPEPPDFLPRRDGLLQQDATLILHAGIDRLKDVAGKERCRQLGVEEAVVQRGLHLVATALQVLPHAPRGDVAELLSEHLAPDQVTVVADCNASIPLLETEQILFDPCLVQRQVDRVGRVGEVGA